MIQPLFNGMLAILLAKFCLNDLPHAAGLAGNPKVNEALPEELVRPENLHIRRGGENLHALGIEDDHLFRRLYGEIYKDPRAPEKKFTNPVVTPHEVAHAEFFPHWVDEKGYTYTPGDIDYTYWPPLKIGIIDHAYVSLPRRGLGSILVKYAIDEMRSHGIVKVYTMTVSEEGYLLFLKLDFTPAFEAPFEPAPWRRFWLVKDIR